MKVKASIYKNDATGEMILIEKRGRMFYRVRVAPGGYKKLRRGWWRSFAKAQYALDMEADDLGWRFAGEQKKEAL